MDHAHQHHTSTHSWVTYAPLILLLVLLGVFALSLGHIVNEMTPMFVMRMYMGGFFLLFGGLKVIRWKQFAATFQTYDILGARSTVYRWTYPAIEIAFSLLYFTGIALIGTNIAVFVVMTIGFIGIVNELRSQREVTCACLGTVFDIPLSYISALEDLLMAAMAVIMTILLL